MVPDRFGAGARRRWPTRLGRWGYLGVGHRLRSLPVRAELSPCQDPGCGAQQAAAHLGWAESERLKRSDWCHRVGRRPPPVSDPLIIYGSADSGWTRTAALIAAAADPRNDRPLDGV